MLLLCERSVAATLGSSASHAVSPPPFRARLLLSWPPPSFHQEKEMGCSSSNFFFSGLSLIIISENLGGGGKIGKKKTGERLVAGESRPKKDPERRNL